MVHTVSLQAPTAVRFDPCKRHLSVARQRLAALMQRLSFGTIHNLQVRAGEPVLDPRPRTIRRKKNGGNNHPRPQAGASDFALKRELVEFFADVDAMGDGIVLLIEVAHGLPIIHEFEDVIDV